MDFLPLPDNAARQLIDSITVFDEHMRVQAQARRYSGGMYWKRQGDYEYLVRTAPDNRQSRMGPRGAETEKTFDDFIGRKREIEARLKSLREARNSHQRQGIRSRLPAPPARGGRPTPFPLLGRRERPVAGAGRTRVRAHQRAALRSRRGVGRRAHGADAHNCSGVIRRVQALDGSEGAAAARGKTAARPAAGRDRAEAAG